LNELVDSIAIDAPELERDYITSIKGEIQSNKYKEEHLAIYLDHPNKKIREYYQ